MLRFKKNNAVDFPDLEKTTLGEVCTKIGDGLHSAPAYDVDGEYYFINGNNLKDGAIIITSDTKKVSKETFLKNDKGLDGHTILLSINGTIGNLAYYKNENVMLGKSAAYLKIKESVDKEYIYQLLQTRKVKTSFLLSLTGTTIKNLGLEAINKTHIFIPVLEEQHKIADFLSSVDDVIQLHEQEITVLEEQKKGIMQKLFNREVKFKADEGSEYPEWEKKELAHIVNLSTGKSYSNDLNNNGKYIVMDMGAVSKDGEIIALKHTNLNRDVLNKGDLIMPKDDIGGGLIICKTAFIISDNKYVLGDHVYRLQFPSENSLFMHYLINSERVNLSLKKKVTGSAQLGIKASNLLKEKLCIPCLEEQQKIADCLSAYDETIQIKKDKLEIWKEIKKGLLQQMFV